MRKDIIEKVTRFYKERLSFYKSLRDEALVKARQNKDIALMEKRLKEIKVLTLQGKNNEDIDKEYDELYAKFDTAIREYLPHIKYECEDCKDTGIVGNKYCKCFISRYTEELKKRSNVESMPTFTFEDSSIDDYALSDEDRARYTKIYERMQRYADDYPNVAKHNIFLRGQSGSGKTCLISAIANKLISRGVSLQYITAFDLAEMMLASHLDYKNNSLSFITSADVLIIDDLGSEPMRSNINTTYLQSILDSRIVHEKSTIVTTNLTPEQLMKKYGERVISRLLSSNTTIAIDFGNLPNLRITKK